MTSAQRGHKKIPQTLPTEGGRGQTFPNYVDVIYESPLGIFSLLFSAALLGMKLRSFLAAKIEFPGKRTVKCYPLCESIDPPRPAYSVLSIQSHPFPSLPGNEYYVDRENEMDGQ